MVTALARVSETVELGVGNLDLSAIPPRRVVELARYGVAAKDPALRRHPHARRLASLLATARWLQAKAVDDAIELLDVLMTNDLLARATRQSTKEQLRRSPRVSRDAAKLAAAVAVLLDVTESGKEISLDRLWAAIEATVSRAELRAGVEHVAEVTPAAGTDADGEWRAVLVERFATVRGFLAPLCSVIDFGATAEAAPVPAAMRELPAVLATRATTRFPAGSIDAERTAMDVVPPSWRWLVLAADRPAGCADKAAYALRWVQWRLVRRSGIPGPGPLSRMH